MTVSIASPVTVAIASIWASGAAEEPRLDETEVIEALGALGPVWDELYPAEQACILRLLIERIDVAPDGIYVTLHAAGIRSLVAELAIEAAGGVVLVAAALIALVWANSPFGGLYSAFLDAPGVIQAGALKIAKPLLLWINDGLMAIFFLLVGLEIKREVLEGELSSVEKAALPGFAAVGGMAVPALVYLAFNWGDPVTSAGRAIPAATDIAFALGVLALVGESAPVSLRIFLLALAIMDDLGAIIIIAIFYTADLSLLSLALAAGGLVALLALNLWQRDPNSALRADRHLRLVWVCVLKSGVHATLAGVALACAGARRSRRGGRRQGYHARDVLKRPTDGPWTTLRMLVSKNGGSTRWGDRRSGLPSG